MSLALNLLVLRCKELERTRQFYEHLGLVFIQEQHGKGPVHYASEMAGLVLELYPATEKQLPDKTRLGFTTSQLGELADDISRSPEIVILKPLVQQADRLVIVLQDPDGRTVEISQQLHDVKVT